MQKKSIPLWSSETLQCLTQQPCRVIYADDHIAFLTDLKCKNSYLFSNGEIEELDFAIEHVLPLQHQTFCLLTISPRHRYEAYIFSESGSHHLQIPKSPMAKQHSIFCRLPDGSAWLIGGPAVSPHEIYFNVYCLQRDSKSWSSVKDNQLLRQKLQNPKNVYAVLGENLWVLCKKAEQFVYAELLVYSLRDLRLVDVRQIKNQMRFTAVPKIGEDGTALYLFDLNNLYRLNNDKNSDKSPVKVNRGVFLTQPADMCYFRVGFDSLWVWSTSNRETIKRQSIKIDDLEDLEANSDNLPLSFYFNKPIYSDLLFSVQQKQIHCSRQVFEFYSRKFRKILLQQREQRQLTVIKLELRFSTFYFLTQILYSQFRSQLKFDEQTMLELLLFSNKLQIPDLQRRCEEAVVLTPENFQQLYDFYRNVETSCLRDRLFKYFVTNYKEIVRVLPIGKLEEIVRCLYQPDCQHTILGVIKTRITEDLVVSRRDGVKTIQRFANIEGLLQDSELTIKICEKCGRAINTESIW